jgi:3-oxoacyl-[acyl-carrier protein] reductase
VNIVSPGLTQETGFFPEGLDDALRESLIARSANKRPGKPEDVAATISFLASPEAGHITGHVLPVNGGSQQAR